MNLRTGDFVIDCAGCVGKISAAYEDGSCDVELFDGIFENLPMAALNRIDAPLFYAIYGIEGIASHPST